MKKFLFAALMVSSLPIFAASVKITSFYVVNNDPSYYHAELCGLVEGATTNPTFVKVLVDPRRNRPATYNTLAGADGKFCVAVVTYSRIAQVSIIGDEKAAPVTAKID